MDEMLECWKVGISIVYTLWAAGIKTNMLPVTLLPTKFLTETRKVKVLFFGFETYGESI